MFWWRGPHLGGREPGDGRAVVLHSTRLSPQAWGTPNVPNCLRPGHVGGLSHSLCPHQAFFTERDLQEHPEAHEKIEKLKDLIAWQVNVSRQLQGRDGESGAWDQIPMGLLSTPASRHKVHTTVFVLHKPTHRHCN